ncbi:MAG: ABC transporter permease [Acidobacteriaceae bacterium]|nr:ABC transporter permease [Acidobacteriaceae bacterium]
MFRRLRSLFRVLKSRQNFEDGMADELRFHIEQCAGDLMRSGMSREEAYRRARLELGHAGNGPGGLNTLQENCRQERRLHWADEIVRNARYAARLLRKAPAFTVTALLTLALCLGANLTIFAVIDAILVRPLLFPQADRLVTIFNTYPKANVERDGSSITNYYERRGAIPAFSSLSIYRFGTAIVGQPGSTIRDQITQVSPDFFTTLGVGPAIGRTFTDAEMTQQTDHVVILSNECWRQHFNADPHAIGRTVWVNSVPEVVIGVLPGRFHFLSSKSSLYLPLSSTPEQRLARERHSGGNVTQMIARLKPDATLALAQAQIDAQNTALERDDPQAKMMADAGFRSLVVPLHADQVAAIRPILLLLQAGVLALLIIGTVNLVNLLLIRASSRLKEVAVRQALGASGTRVAAEVLVETILLTFAGGLLSLAVGGGGIRLITALGADRLPLGGYIVFDSRLAIVALLAAVALGVVLAAPIAWFNLKPHPGKALQAESRGATTGRAAQALRHSFIVAQIALAFVLLAGAGLLGLSLKRAMDIAPGFQPDHTVAGQISLVGNRYPSPDAGVAFADRLVSQLGEQPGVSAVGIANNIPFSGANGKSAATAQDHVLRPGESPRGYYSYGVAGNYFKAMGFSLRAGRFLTAGDSHRTARTCVVDEDFARYNWPNTNPVGQRVFDGSQPGKDADAFTVVGVVGRIKQAGLTDDTAQGAVYYPYIYRPDANIFVVLRGSIKPDALKATLQSTVRQIDPNLAINELQSMTERISASLLDRRSPALLSGIFSTMALLLIGIGTYGVLSYAVTQRRREIAVRMAVGARPSEIRRQFLLLALRLLAGGAILGLCGAWVTARAMQAILFHVPAHNLPVLAGATSVIALVALAACLLPAHRAARISPIQALAE